MEPGFINHRLSDVYLRTAPGASGAKAFKETFTEPNYIVTYYAVDFVLKQHNYFNEPVEELFRYNLRTISEVLALFCEKKDDLRESYHPPTEIAGNALSADDTLIHCLRRIVIHRHNQWSDCQIDREAVIEAIGHYAMFSARKYWNSRPINHKWFPNPHSEDANENVNASQVVNSARDVFSKQTRIVLNKQKVRKSTLTSNQLWESDNNRGMYGDYVKVINAIGKEIGLAPKIDPAQVYAEQVHAPTHVPNPWLEIPADYTVAKANIEVNQTGQVVLQYLTNYQPVFTVMVPTEERCTAALCALPGGRVTTTHHRVAICEPCQNWISTKVNESLPEIEVKENEEVQDFDHDLSLDKYESPTTFDFN